CPPSGRDSSQTCRAVSLLQTGEPDPTSRRIGLMLADELDYAVGVETHRDEHALAVVDAHTGAVIAQTTVDARGRGYLEAVCFAARHAPGARVWAVEGAGHYGAGFVRRLQRRGEQVHGVERAGRAERRLRGKDDRLDAVRAARSSLAHTHRARPRGG